MSIDFASDVGRVRLLIGDTDETDLILTDDQIGAFVAGGVLAQPSDHLAAAAAARAIGALFTRRATSLSAGGTATTWGDRAKRYYDLADQLRAADAEADDEGGAFDVVSMGVDAFSRREILRDAVLRGSA